MTTGQETDWSASRPDLGFDPRVSHQQGEAASALQLGDSVEAMDFYLDFEAFSGAQAVWKGWTIEQGQKATDEALVLGPSGNSLNSSPLK